MEGLKTKYFVLNPTSHDPVHAEASRCAMMEYAKYVQFANTHLALDVINQALEARAEEVKRNEAASNRGSKAPNGLGREAD